MTPTTIAGNHNPNTENSNTGCGGRLAPPLVCPVITAIYCTVALVVSVGAGAGDTVLSGAPCDVWGALFESIEVVCPPFLFEEEESSRAAVITIVVTIVGAFFDVLDT